MHGALILLHLATHYGHIAAVEHDVVPMVAQGVLSLLILGKHHQSRRVAIQAMHDIDTMLATAALNVVVEDRDGRALFLSLGVD